MSKIRQSADPVDQGEPHRNQCKDDTVNSAINEDVHVGFEEGLRFEA
jgi:hypothetical protein